MSLIQKLRLWWSGEVNGCFWHRIDHDSLKCKRCGKQFHIRSDF
ncbi:hypothetical protein [Xanthomonas phage Xp15]|uniref:Uncharacterized protein n=1 Tax=Xanthomonas phage Xp15 TaxID=322855 RepID=Q52PR1_9CAUD|nr:hypothetical protein XPXV15_gp61 [Xanthomonas phage Xp15]AAX84897.1 hypothetical protein [Xanthomonas phage Xp15]